MRWETEHPSDETGDERAVSDVLAFVLVFGVIITSVGVVYIFGIGALGDTQNVQQDRNAERAFETMAESFVDLQTNRGEERLHELNPRGARMSLDDEDPTVEITGVDGGPVTADAGALHYDNDNTRVSYELGAVFRSDDGNSIMVREPEFVCRDTGSGTRVIVSYVDIVPDGPGAVSSENTMQIEGIQTGQERYEYDGSSPVELRIEDSSHGDAWIRYFEDDDNDWELDSGSSDGNLTAECDVGSGDSVVVLETEMDLSVERSED